MDRKKIKYAIIIIGVLLIAFGIAFTLIPESTYEYRGKNMPHIWKDRIVERDRGLKLYDASGKLIDEISITGSEPIPYKGLIYLYQKNTITALNKKGKVKAQIKLPFSIQSMKVKKDHIVAIGNQEAAVIDKKLKRFSKWNANAYFIDAVTSGSNTWFTSILARNDRILSQIMMLNKENHLMMKQTLYDETIYGIDAIDDEKVIIFTDQNIYIFDGVTITNKISMVHIKDFAVTNKKVYVLTDQVLHVFDFDFNEEKRVDLKKEYKLFASKTYAVLYNDQGYLDLMSDETVHQKGIIGMTEYNNTVYWIGRNKITKIGG